VLPLREASRQLVRELGFLDEVNRAFALTHSQCHALLELEAQGAQTAGELADRLNLEKSTLSRVVSSLEKAGYVRFETDENDKRRRPINLTRQGHTQLRRIHTFANAQVQGALVLLDVEQRHLALTGVRLYAKALGRVRQQRDFTIEPMAAVYNAAVAQVIRTVMPEFGANGPGFAIHDAEVDRMAAAYRRKGHGYFVVRRADRVVGGAGYGPLAGAEPGVCELRKMYFLPAGRGVGMGRRLLDHVLRAACAFGYHTCYLETFRTMGQAQRLYESMGFRRLRGPLGHTGHGACDQWYARELSSSELDQ